MATRLDAVGTAFSTGRRRRGLRLADEAARACLERAGRDPHGVDLLVNAGLYHDRLLGEPALAAIVQDDIEANPEDPHGDEHGTFSFDVANGACGMLTGLQVADGFLRSGTIRHALVVASDADPGRRLAPGFPYPPAGAAILCGWDDGPGGLSDVRFATRPVDGGGQRAVVAWEQRRNRLSIAEEAEFLRDAAALATEVAAACLDEHHLPADEVDLLVANPLRPDYLDRLAGDLGVPADRVVRVPDRADAHTAALGVALDEGQRSAAWPRAGTVLLVSAGGRAGRRRSAPPPARVRPRHTVPEASHGALSRRLVVLTPGASHRPHGPRGTAPGPTTRRPGTRRSRRSAARGAAAARGCCVPARAGRSATARRGARRR